MTLFSFQHAKAIWQNRDFPPPWEAPCKPIHSHIADLIDLGGDPNRQDLPDAPKHISTGGLRFVSGALDNILGGPTGDPQAVAKAVKKVITRPTASRIQHLYTLITQDGAIGLVDDTMARVAQDPPAQDRFAILFEWLARSSPDREAVKFAMAMLGMLETDQFKDLFLTLGAHEEFTKYAAVALSNALGPDRSRDALVALAKSVRGWGRIDLVERLAPNADADFRHWLVRDGFRNEVMYEYLAYAAAYDGQLLKQLSAQKAKDDDALLDGAADIFIALVSGGPARDMTDYADGAVAARQWFKLIGDRPVTLLWGYAAKSFKSFAERDNRPHAWDAETTTHITKQAARCLSSDHLAVTITKTLQTGDGQAFWLAHDLAPATGIDPWPATYARQSGDPQQELWFNLMQTNDAGRIDKVLALAEAQLPLDELMGVPQDELGLGPDWRRHSALDYIVQDLDKHPTKGWPLIATALRSPVVRNRNMAIKALGAWDKADWPGDALALIRQAFRDEPCADTKDDLGELLQPGAR